MQKYALAPLFLTTRYVQTEVPSPQPTDQWARQCLWRMRWRHTTDTVLQ